MRVLTLTQPWASLVAIGAKRYETRGWKAPPGPLAIHAGKNLAPVGGVGGLVARCAEEPFFSTLFNGGPFRDPTDLPRGVVLCVVDVGYCVPTERVIAGEDERFEITAAPHELAFGDYSEGRFAWALYNLHGLPTPLRARGRQKLWTIDMADPRP